MARPERFELPTAWFVARYSIQLSYGRVVMNCGSGIYYQILWGGAYTLENPPLGGITPAPEARLVEG
jgi:hypothetical protein